MSATHTPGPWKVKGSGTITDSDGDLIATCGYRVTVGSTEDDDNARLIASAPELLDACLAILHWYEIDSSEYNRELAIRATRDAVTKAGAA